MAFGTLTTWDTLATQAVQNLSIAQFGEDLAFQAIQEAFDAHNMLLNESLTDLVDVTTDRLRRYGGPDSMAMEELDEFGTPDAQKITAGSNVGFPLKFYGVGLQWSRLFFQNAKTSELVAQTIAAQDADVKAIHRELKKALLFPTNYTFSDRRVDHLNLPIKALVNADGAPIPVAPDGTTFNANTHTHYLATAALASADMTALTETVIEHFLSGQVQVLINRAQETTVRALSGFTAYLDARLIPATTAVAAMGNLDPAQLTNRAIGIYGSAEVWVKPWIPPGYMVCMHIGANDKALAMRKRTLDGGNLELLFDNEEYPLRARALGREFGFGVWNRVAAAVLYTGGASYVAPSITAL